MFLKTCLGVREVSTKSVGGNAGKNGFFVFRGNRQNAEFRKSAYRWVASFRGWPRRAMFEGTSLPLKLRYMAKIAGKNGFFALPGNRQTKKMLNFVNLPADRYRRFAGGPANGQPPMRSGGGTEIALKKAERFERSAHFCARSCLFSLLFGGDASFCF